MEGDKNDRPKWINTVFRQTVFHIIVNNTDPIINLRAQKLIDLYKKNYVEYPWATEDEQEQIFECRKSLRLNTYTCNIEPVYRVRDPIDKSKEYYIYQKKGKILNQNDDAEYSNSLTYGFVVEPECASDLIANITNSYNRCALQLK